MKIGQSVNVVLKPELKCIGVIQAPYYSGQGVIKAIKNWSGYGDIEYFYAVYPDRIEVYETPFDGQLDTWKLIQTVNLKAETPSK